MTADDNIHSQEQTALVLQGGGALGAYEAGCYQEIYKQASQQHPDGRLFDIIAGTSIGAINSSVLVGYYLKNGNSWEGSDKALLEFWQGLETPTFADALIRENHAVANWWNYLHSLNPGIADAETARRFWSIFEFSFTTLGVPHMYRPVPQWGSKYFNPYTDFLPWWRYDYEPLREYLSSFVDFPIKTSFEKGQPRLLLTSVDVEDYTSAVVFDSYEKLHPAFDSGSTSHHHTQSDDKQGENSNRWYSQYGTTENPHIVFYDGIGLDQVLASALGKYSLNHPTIFDAVTNSNRELWDGGYLSNTPLRELLASHRKYWREYHKKKNKHIMSRNLVEIPDLEVYIVNLHPSVARDIPTDKDLVDNRENDILFHDRTTFDEMVAYLRTDYVDLARRLVDLAKSNGLSDNVDEILKMEAKSVARIGGEFRFATYKDIIDGRTNTSKVWRIDRHENPGAIYGKTTDFTHSSLRGLILDGQRDAKVSLNLMKIIFAMEDLIADGTVSPKDGEEAVARIRKLMATEELHKKSKVEIIEAYDRFLKTTERIVHTKERRQTLIEPARDILEFFTGAEPAIKSSEG
ncbi:MAG: patatin-like phospholipase family protein [Thermoproteota archaeon]